MSKNNALVQPATKTKFTVADYLLTRLQQLGLDKVFQVPGDYVAEFMDALEAFDGIDAVGDVNELGAGYAADGYARYKGIGAVSVQFGVGTFSALNAIAGAWVERNPVVVITASPTTANRVTIEQTGVLFHHSTGRLGADRNVYSNVTVAAEILSHVDQAPQQIDHALTQAITHRRPIYLEAWQDVWGMECEPPQGTLTPLSQGSQKESLEAMINMAIEKIKSAKKPVVLVGVEIARFGLQEKVLNLLEASGLPYATTTLGKTTLDENAGTFIGTYAGAASNPGTNDYFSESDAILALGVIFTDDYLDILENQFADIIAMDAEQARVGYQHYHNVQLPDFIRTLTEYCEQSCAFPRNDIPLPVLPAMPELTPELLAQPLGYKSFFDVLWGWLVRERLLPVTNLILGESSSLYQAARLVGLPQDSFVGDAAWGSLGHETGCVTGTSMASDKRSLVVAGDGGFMMMCQSLSTITRNQLDAVVFVMSNGVYAIEQSFVDVCAFTPHGEFAPFDILPKWDYLSLATAYNMPGYQVKNCEELYRTLQIVQSQPEQSALVEVLIPEHDLAPALEDLLTKCWLQWLLQ
ncbi:alpha-keto acid decarboxylase family protein [Planctobacterium marinum]|uniref:alpha-keto acid decarboxylase family protein n=1 Tax=Planctobacterium marinum TaxID=1631968 RepID=UPI001E65863C|nr:thiamine pyrophosphate-binding protein [Planctobacterium marinum]MCC2604953.1 thiamine pyrophosphate-dependent enzyme [Planctobacterium marinum]